MSVLTALFICLIFVLPYFLFGYIFATFFSNNLEPFEKFFVILFWPLFLCVGTVALVLIGSLLLCLYVIYLLKKLITKLLKK